MKPTFIGWALILLAGQSAASVWTVDDDQPADFADIQTAIDSVNAGDILLIQPGTYAAFTLTKRLSLLAPPNPIGGQPLVLGKSTVQGALYATLVGLGFETLEIRGVPGRATVDDCNLSGAQNELAALILIDCDQAQISRTFAVGADSCCGSSGTYPPGSNGIYAGGSNLVIVDSSATGGYGEGGYAYSQGGAGIRLVDSTAVIAGCSATGGVGGCWYSLATFSEVGGPGLRAESSQVWVRGGVFDVFAGGHGGCGSFSTWNDIEATGTGTVFYSGIQLDKTSGNTVYYPYPEPYTSCLGSDGIGGTRRVMVHGPAGEPFLLASSFSPSPGPFHVPGFAGLIWLGPPLYDAELLSTQGHASATSKLIPLPPSTPSFPGVALTFQAIFLNLPAAGAPADLAVTNPTEIVLR